MIDEGMRKEFIEYLKKRKGKIQIDNRSLNNRDDIKYAVENVNKYAFSIRLVDINKYSDIRQDFDDVLNHLTDYFCDYFKNEAPSNRKDFDKIFYDLCDKFIEEFNKISDGRCDIVFGRAQKQINMVFKYLACYREYKDKKEYFKYCHMPIDRTIVNLFRDEGIPCLENDEKVKKWDNVAWTKNLNKRRYVAILSAYRKFYHKHDYLAFEFKKWFEMKEKQNK